MFDSNAPKKLYGAAIVRLPIGFFTAKTRAAQVDVLYSVADAPETTKEHAEFLLRTIALVKA